MKPWIFLGSDSLPLVQKSFDLLGRVRSAWPQAVRFSAGKRVPSPERFLPTWHWAMQAAITVEERCAGVVDVNQHCTADARPC